MFTQLPDMTAVKLINTSVKTPAIAEARVHLRQPLVSGLPLLPSPT
jgi:hypothetical protein